MNPQVTKNDFLAYEEVRQAEIVDMSAHSIVSAMTSATKEAIAEIHSNYKYYLDLFTKPKQQKESIMGACFDYAVYRGDKSGLAQWWAQKVDDANYESGHDTYGGHIGTLGSGFRMPVSSPMKTIQEAIDYIEDKHGKWDSAMAVPFAYKGDIPTKTGKAHHERLQKLIDEYNGFGHDVVKRIRATKSKTIGCKNCGSSINRQYVGSVDCPICSQVHAFMTATDIKKLERLRERINEAREKKISTKQGTCIGYVVGGWCAE